MVRSSDRLLEKSRSPYNRRLTLQKLTTQARSHLQAAADLFATASEISTDNQVARKLASLSGCCHGHKPDCGNHEVDSLMKRSTQRQAILNALLAAHGGEVPSYELAAIALQYGARVRELRDLGFPITNRTERRNGQVRGYFKLEMGAKAERDERRISRPETAAETLFDLSVRHRDDG
jgi:hypothetical protein